MSNKINKDVYIRESSNESDTRENKKNRFKKAIIPVFIIIVVATISIFLIYSIWLAKEVL